MRHGYSSCECSSCSNPCLGLLFALAIAVVGGGQAPARSANAGENVTLTKQANTKLAPLVERGVAYLAARQDEDGSYSSFAGTGVTSLITTALLRHGRHPNDPMIARSLAYLQTQVHDDGGIYQQGSRYRNYETCLAILCFSAANHDNRFGGLLKRAEAFVKDLQHPVEVVGDVVQ